MKIELLAITADAEKLIEEAGRTCYQSVAKENQKVGTLIKALIKSGHESVLEHASATFRIGEVSRALTHQLVRHRLCSYSQQSQRYVNEKQFGYVIPEAILNMEQCLINDFKKDMSIIQDMYDKWKLRGLKNEDARFVLPNACHTEIVMTANFREWRTIFKLRCDKHAQWEIRAMACEILKELDAQCPNVFGDLCETYVGIPAKSDEC